MADPFSMAEKQSSLTTWSHADFETGPLPRDKSTTEGDDSDVVISFEFETLKFPAKIGIKSRYQTNWFDLDGCKSSEGGKILRIPLADCNVHKGTVKFFFDATTKMFEFQVSDGKYNLFSLKYSDHPYSLVADFAKGTKLKNFLVQTEEESYIAEHKAKGAVQAVAGDGDDGYCSSGSANCGGSCFGVCLNCGPPRYCMCYENGFTDVYGQKHLGPHCLKRDGDGTTIATPKQGEHGVPAFEGNAPKAPPGVINELKETARLLREIFGRHGWRDHAADFGIKPAIADIIEHIMEAEDKLDQAKPASGAAPEL